MKRRDFLKLMTGLGASLYTSHAFAQLPDKTTLNQIGDKLSDIWVQKVELETIPEDQLILIDGISLDQNCTFSGLSYYTD